jgi:putative transposase
MLQRAHNKQLLTCENAYAERFVRSIKSECLNRMIFIGQRSLRRAVAEYMDHYHGERNHQGLDNGLIRRVPSSVQGIGMVRRKQRLGGMLNFYWREAV